MVTVPVPATHVAGSRAPSFWRASLGDCSWDMLAYPCSKETDERNCTNQYSRAAQISYTFPGWLLARTIDITAAMTYTNETHFGLNIRNRVPDGENSIFDLARSGNVPGIKDLFVRRLISPNDLCYKNGQTALHVSYLWPGIIIFC
jgi:hypothetical protein